MSRTNAARTVEIDSPWLDTNEAAAYIGSTYNTLRAWRGCGRGPKFSNIRTRMVRYHRDDLDAFIRGGGGAAR